MLKGLTSTFKEHCNNIELTYREYIVIDGVQVPVRAKLTDDCYENGNFIGSFILKTIQFETSNDRTYRNKEFEYYKVVDGESIKIGTFITTEIQDNDTKELVKVTGMDYGLKTQVEYTSTLNYESGTITLLDVWNECCQLSGLESGVDEFENSDFIVDSDQFTGTGATIRDVFKGIALSSGSFIKVMNDDKIYPIFKTHTETLMTSNINTQATLENVQEIDKINELKGDTYQQTYTGKNLNIYPYSNVGYPRGITFTVNNDGTVVLNGQNDNTGHSSKYFYNSQTPRVIPAGTYYFIPPADRNIEFVMYDGTSYYGFQNSNNFSYTFNTSKNITQFYMQVRKGVTTTFNNLKVYPMLTTLPNQTESDYEPYVGGVPSPNPDYPQNIESVTGLQNISIKSKNLKNENNIFDGYFNSTTFISGANNNTMYIPIEDNTTYYVEKIASKRFRLCLLNSVPEASATPNNYIANDTETSLSITNTNYKYLCLFFWTNNDTISKQEILDSINIYTTSNDYEVNLGKNLFNPALVNNIGGIVVEDNKIIMPIITSGNGQVNTTKKLKELCPDIKAGEYYFLSFTRTPTGYNNYIYLVGGGDVGWNNNTSKLITDELLEKTVILYANRYNQGETDQVTLSNFQIERGQEATTYAPYFEPIELNKIDTYRDRIYKSNDKWYIEKKIGKLILDENSNWSKQTNYYQCTTNVGGIGGYGYSNYYSYGGISTPNSFWATANAFRTNDSTDTLQNYKNWLSTHNIVFYYVKGTATTEEITNQELINQLESIRLLKGTNNISITSEDLSGEINLSYWKDDTELIEDYTELEDKRDTHPITCVRLGMSQVDGENVDMIDPDLVEEYGENWLILNDNPFAYNQSKREQLITAIFNKVKGFGYSAFVSKTSFKPYLVCGDKVRFKNRNGDLIDSILLRYSHEYKEKDMQIQLEAPSETSATVNYVYPLTAIDISKRTQIEVDKDNVRITDLTQRTTEVETDLRNNRYTKEETNILIQTAETGLTNTFSKAGGNNIFRNTGLFFVNHGSDSSINPYEFWNGKVARGSEDKASNQNCLILQNDTVSQEQTVPNGMHTVSFKYKKLIAVSNAKVIINENEYELTGTTDTDFLQVVEVNSKYIRVQFVCDVDNGCEIYDLMVNAGEVALAYSQNQNETTTNTVNISKGIEITSSEKNTKFRADSDGIRVYNKDSNEVKTEFTDRGMETDQALIETKAEIVKTLWQNVNNHTWITRL